MKALLAVLATVLASVGAAIGAWCWSGGDRADLAAWVEAVATVSAFGAAGVAAAFAYRAFKLESVRDARWMEAQTREQASQVAAWVDFEQSEGGPWKPGVRRPVVLIRNASDLPVTDVVVELMLRLVSDEPGDSFRIDDTALPDHAVSLCPPDPEPRSLPLSPDPPLLVLER